MIERLVVLDTETTGLSAKNGDRIIEIGAVEVVQMRITTRSLHFYINPEREVTPQAYQVHGIGNEFLADKPVFNEIVDKLTEFLEEDQLVIHNAPFDIGFLNAELARCNRQLIDKRRVIDTLAKARKLYPGSPVSLDALCRRYSIDSAARDLHGALLDSQLLAQIYIEMMGGREPDLFSINMPDGPEQQTDNRSPTMTGQEERHGSLLRGGFGVTDAEAERHQAFLDHMANDSAAGVIWSQKS